MFRGITAINLDPKGRIAIPTKYREQLITETERRIVLTIDTESPCLLLYPFLEWGTIEAKISALPSFNKAARRIQRLLIGHATEIELDPNGRILVPAVLQNYAKLNKTLMLVGQGKKFELWDNNVWEEHRSQWLQEEAAGENNLPEDLQTISL